MNRTFIPFCIVVHIAPSAVVVTLSGQLTSAKVGSTNYAYSYDTAGNLLTKTDGGTSHSYTYGNTKWADLLTAYDGNAITYDGCGNPTSYYNGARMSMTWMHGRQLAAVNTNISYAYDMVGVRSSKTVNGTTYKFTTLSGLVTRQSWGSNYIEFIYDESSQPFAMRYNGTLYYYVLNIQGDVVGLLNTSGTMVATYTYDPWGKVISSTGGTLASVNPLRYRGYYYDSETGFYYLQSRYYDPAIGRFINADTYATTDATNARSSNMFAYCENDPVNRSDPGGEIFVGAMLTGAAIGMGVQLMSDMVYAMVTGQPFDECLSSVGTYASAAVSGALSTISGGGALRAGAEIIGTAYLQTCIDIAVTPHEYKEKDPNGEILESVGIGVASRRAQEYVSSEENRIVSAVAKNGTISKKLASTTKNVLKSAETFMDNIVGTAWQILKSVF